VNGAYRLALFKASHRTPRFDQKKILGSYKRVTQRSLFTLALWNFQLAEFINKGNTTASLNKTNPEFLMGYEVWGAFSVKDHLSSNAFVADLMLFDRLVIPVPPKNNGQEWARWRVKEKWDPDRQREIIDVIESVDKNRLLTIEWNKPLQDAWAERFNNAKQIADGTKPNAFQATRSELTAIKTGVLFLFVIGTATIGMFTDNIPAHAAAGATAFLSLGQFAAEKLIKDRSSNDRAALFHDVRRHFGWK
jgi:hypothetical protein